MASENRTSQAGRPEAVQLRARRSPRVVALGILCMVLGALGAAALYTSVSDNSSVVMVTRKADCAASDIPAWAEMAVSYHTPTLKVDESGLKKRKGSGSNSSLPVAQTLRRLQNVFAWL